MLALCVSRDYILLAKHCKCETATAIACFQSLITKSGRYNQVSCCTTSNDSVSIHISAVFVYKLSYRWHLLKHILSTFIPLWCCFVYRQRLENEEKIQSYSHTVCSWKNKVQQYIYIVVVSNCIGWNIVSGLDYKICSIQKYTQWFPHKTFSDYCTVCTH